MIDLIVSLLYVLIGWVVGIVVTIILIEYYTNPRPGSDEWVDSRIVAWLNRPYPEVKIPLAKERASDWSNWYTSDSWVVLITRDTGLASYYHQKRLIMMIHDFDDTGDDIIYYIENNA